MKYFLDTEFIERGHQHPIQLISIGIVSEAGDKYYAISENFEEKTANEWVLTNVIAHLESDVPRTPVIDIAAEILDFIGPVTPEFWGYYADYDWVVFCQLFGVMIDLPAGWPMYCRDIKQLCDDLGNPDLPPQNSSEHNALSDAEWNRTAHRFLEKLRAQRGKR